MKRLYSWAALVALLVCGSEVFAVKHGSISLGVGSYSQRGDRQVATGPRSTGTSPRTVTPLIFRYEYELSGRLYFAPQLMLTVAPVKSWDESYTTAIHNLALPLGGPIGSGGGVDYDWGLGVGLMYYEMKGKGGTVTLRNGTGTMEFALADGSKSSKLITTNFGLSANIERHRLGLDLLFESLLSNEKRAYSYLIGYSYRFGGAY